MYLKYFELHLLIKNKIKDKDKPLYELILDPYRFDFDSLELSMVKILIQVDHEDELTYIFHRIDNYRLNIAYLRDES